MVKVGRFSKPWPILVNRAELLGLQPEVVIQGRRASLKLTSEANNLRVSHRAKRKTPKLMFGFLIAIALGGAFIPLPASSAEFTKIKTPIDECSENQLQGYFTKPNQATKFTLVNRIDIGGVASGEVICKGSKYKYVLETVSPEHVLSLQKLDS